ncbi:hypothetical protein [Rheinheimera sp.]|uniref:hypothetical protein n=1 Tax=Rheinheimera sp. TaxID=1869214 RepID=UPI00307E98D9
MVLAHHQPALSAAIRSWLSGFAATAFTLTLILLMWAMVSLIGQTQDIVTQLNAELRWASPQIALSAAAALLWFSLMSWWSARYIFQQTERWITGYQGDEQHRPTAFISAQTALWLPRVYSVAPGVLLFVTGVSRGLYGTAFLGVLVALLALVLVLSRKSWRHAALLSQTGLDQTRSWQWLSLGFTALMALFSIFFLPQTAALLGAFNTLFIGLGSLLCGMTFGVYFVTRWCWNWPVVGVILQPPVPVLSLAVAAALAISAVLPTDNHGIRRCLTAAGADAALQCPTPAASASYAYPDLAAAWKDFSQKLEQHQAGPGLVPVFFVASEGGGLRASYWTGLVMSELEKQIPGFSAHVFSLAGVSGGSVGNSFYAAALAEQQQNQVNGALLQQQLQQAVGQDYLTPVTTSFLYNDLLFRFLPLQFDPYQQDRAQALERSWERGFASVFTVAGDAGLSQPLQQFYRPSAQDTKRPWLPLLLSLGSHQEAGAIVVTAPFPVDAEDFPASYDVYQLMGCRSPTGLSCDLRLSTAALNAARFPFVTPAGSINYDLRTGDTAVSWSAKTHIIDGGYLDNFGATVTRQLIARLAQRGAFDKKPDGQQLVPIALVISNDPALEPNILNLQRTAPDNTSSMVANELTAPLQGLLSARQGQGYSALTQLLVAQNQSAVVMPYFKYQPEQGSVLQNSLVFRLPPSLSDVPLGWWLSDHAQLQMQQQLDAEQAAGKLIKALQDQMTAHP